MSTRSMRSSTSPTPTAIVLDAMGDDAPEDRVASAMLSYTEEYKNTPRPDRMNKMSVLSEEATYFYRTEGFEDALQRFVQQIVLIDIDDTRPEPDTRAGLVSNCASCLHLLGEEDLARRYYLRARDVFAAYKPGRLSRFLWGNVNAARVKYIDARLELLANGEKPDTSKYLDAVGNSCSWEGAPQLPASLAPPKPVVPPTSLYDELPSRETLKSYVSPSAWRAWYRGEVPFVQVVDTPEHEATATASAP